ncbi:DUF3592 domain-containing protein [Micromonospora chalcea]
MELDDWAVTLRERGTPARAVVVDQVTESGGNRSPSSSTMYFSYEVDGRTHAQEVACFEVCRAAGAEVSIWVNPADLACHPAAARPAAPGGAGDGRSRVRGPGQAQAQRPALTTDLSGTASPDRPGRSGVPGRPGSPPGPPPL